jgi:acetate kinase
VDLAGLRILVVNAGSTSLKLSLVDGDDSQPVDDFVAADAVAHRVVHGGELREPTIVDDALVARLHALVDLAPLHNAPALAGIEAARRALPDVPHVAVFDTAFHATIPEIATTYALPAERRGEIHRYGFHGLSVQWASEQVRVPRLIVCHLGGGCSVTAVRDGRSIDTTMGFTPLEGLPGATRSGSVDPGALLYLVRRGLTVEELDRMLEHDSGLAALGGLDDPLGFGVFTYAVAKAVAAMAAALGGLDALVFTAGIGENRPDVRAAVTERVRHLGAEVHVVPAREDVVAARHARAVLSKVTAA